MTTTAGDRAGELLAAACRIAVLTGAGISTSAGIPDFRGPDGLWTKNPEAERASTIHVYLTDESARRASWRMRTDQRLATVQPTPGHHAIVDLERQGRLVRVVTQNIDALHQKAGNDPALVTEVHGSMGGIRCVECRADADVDEVLDRVRAGDDDPRCTVCGGILKTTVVMFGEMLPDGAMDEALRAVDEADLFLAVGTTLAVSPVNAMAWAAAERRIPVVIVNRGETEGDHLAAAKVDAAIDEVLPGLLAMP